MGEKKGGSRSSQGPSPLSSPKVITFGEERGEPSFIDDDGVKLDLNFINKAATILFKSIPLYNTLSNHVRTGEWQH